MKKALLYFLAFIAVQLTVGGTVGTVMKLIGLADSMDSGSVLITASAIGSIITLVLFLAMKWCIVSRSYVRSRPWWTLSWTALLAIGIVIPLTWMEEQLPESWQTNIIADEMEKMLRSTEGYFVVCMLAPLMEEVVFRGAIIRALREWFGKRWGTSPWLNDISKGEWTAITVSAALFAAAHMNPAQIPHALLVGMLLGWLFVKTNSIVPSLLVHWINNSASYVMMNLFPTLPMDAKLADYFGNSNAAVTQAVVCSLLIALPSLYQLVKVKRNDEVRYQEVTP